MDKAILTCALTGVLTDPKQHPVPVTAQEMAAAAREAYNAGASIMHVHLRQQTPGMGRFPSWDPAVAAEIDTAIREACPDVIINLTTGVVGTDISGPVACIRAVRPEIAACNAGSLNYLKIKDNGEWAWPLHAGLPDGALADELLGPAPPLPLEEDPAEKRVVALLAS